MQGGSAPVLQVERLTKRFGDRIILDEVSLEVGAGEIVGLYGARGAGKRKLLDAIVGNERADAGRIVLDGCEVTNLSGMERRRLGIASQLHQAPVWDRLREALRTPTVEQRLERAAARAGRPREERAELVQEALRTFDLTDFVGRRRYLDQFSFGIRGRALLAELVIGRPRLLVLDEPFKSFDTVTLPHYQTLLHDICETRRIAILLSDRSGHSRNVCNRMYFLADGKIGTSDDAMKIFISYRRQDEAGFAQALFQELNDTFHRHQLFLDVEDYIKPGEDFASALYDQLKECDVVLVMIGPRWLAAADERGARRLDDPADWVRIEIASALAAAKHVIPVLVGGAEMPREEAVAEQLRPLCRLQAVRIGADGFKSDVDRLVRRLKSMRRPISNDRARRLQAGGEPD